MGQQVRERRTFIVHESPNYDSVLKTLVSEGWLVESSEAIPAADPIPGHSFPGASLVTVSRLQKVLHRTWKYEYRSQAFVVLDGEGEMLVDRSEELTKLLNGLATGGWVLVNLGSYPTGRSVTAFFVMKRLIRS